MQFKKPDETKLFGQVDVAGSMFKAGHIGALALVSALALSGCEPENDESQRQQQQEPEQQEPQEQAANERPLIESEENDGGRVC
jgi:hypothetical protein